MTVESAVQYYLLFIICLCEDGFSYVHGGVMKIMCNLVCYQPNCEVHALPCFVDGRGGWELAKLVSLSQVCVHVCSCMYTLS